MDIRIKDLFSGVVDPRIDRTKKHPLERILYIVLCGTVSGVDSWIGYQDYAEEHFEILSTFIELPHGAPSHDTISRVIESLDVEVFANCFESFVATLTSKANDRIAIDGKSMRGSHDRKKGIKAKHIVSAWAHNCKLVLAQEKVDDKSNEITAIPRLLERLDLQGRIVTLDAMGCQRDICSQIVDKGGDYLISLKGKQSSLHEDVRVWFEDASNVLEHVWEEWDKGHGRIEHRLCRSSGDIDWLQPRHNWPGLKSISAVHSTRETAKGIQKEVRYYISSLPAHAARIGQATRDHWGIENSLHWVLDVTMNEDKSRIRNENAPEIMAIMRKWGLNLINKHKGKTSVKRMMRKCAMSPKNLLFMLKKI